MHGRRKRAVAWLLGVIVLTAGVGVEASTGSLEPGEKRIIVGRISHIAGEVLRHLPEEDEWAPVEKDGPFALDDILYAEEGARAEVIIPNNTWARIGDGTRIRVVELRDDMTDLEVTSGIARFYNKGSSALIRVRTPFGDVTAPGGTDFDILVSEDSVEVISLRGRAYFEDWRTGERHEVNAGSSSIVVDDRSVHAGSVHGDPAWSDWNRERDDLWAERMESYGESREYLPSDLSLYAHELDDHGLWDRVYYNGHYHYFWRPLHVAPSWAPYTSGRWVVLYGENTWIPYDPFGYVTHHYGSWIRIGSRWYWASPLTGLHVRIGAPLFRIPLTWYPGRVAWVRLGVRIGWIPLGPRERYVARRRWGPGTVVVVKRAHVKEARAADFRYFKHAVIVHERDLYREGSAFRRKALARKRDRGLNDFRFSPFPERRTVKRSGALVLRRAPAPPGNTRNSIRATPRKVPPRSRGGGEGVIRRPAAEHHERHPGMERRFIEKNTKIGAASSSSRRLSPPAPARKGPDTLLRARSGVRKEKGGLPTRQRALRTRRPGEDRSAGDPPGRQARTGKKIEPVSPRTRGILGRPHAPGKAVQEGLRGEARRLRKGSTDGILRKPAAIGKENPRASRNRGAASVGEVKGNPGGRPGIRSQGNRLKQPERAMSPGKGRPPSFKGSRNPRSHGMRTGR